jgi:hypothetical protein
MAVPSTNEGRLAAAQAARHQLITGGLPVEVEIAGGMRVTYAPADRDALESYISELQAAIAGTQTRGALGFIL